MSYEVAIYIEKFSATINAWRILKKSVPFGQKGQFFICVFFDEHLMNCFIVQKIGVGKCVQSRSQIKAFFSTSFCFFATFVVFTFILVAFDKSKRGFCCLFVQGIDFLRKNENLPEIELKTTRCSQNYTSVDLPWQLYAKSPERPLQLA